MNRILVTLGLLVLGTALALGALAAVIRPRVERDLRADIAYLRASATEARRSPQIRI